MLDYDLAALYGYEVRALNQQVKRIIGRFPDDFMFQLTKDEVEAVKSQIVTSPNFNLVERTNMFKPLIFNEFIGIIITTKEICF